MAGLAAAIGLAAQGIETDVFEARQCLGGRFLSSDDSEGNESTDGCQHVGMGWDVNFLQFCTQIGAAKGIERQSRLHFFGPDGRRSDLYAVPGLPAPIHLAAAFFRLKFVKWRDRWKILKAMRELAAPVNEEDAELTAQRWLRLHDQSLELIERFWSPIVGALLRERLDTVSFSAWRKVILCTFLQNRGGFSPYLLASDTQRALMEPAKAWLISRGARVLTSAPVRLVLGSSDRCQGVLLEDGTARPFDLVIVAAGCRELSHLFAASLQPAIPSLPNFDSWQTIPLTFAHLWFDRPLTPLSHAIAIQSHIQWVVRRHPRAAADIQSSGGFNYQITMNVTTDWQSKSKEEVVNLILKDLTKIWPTCHDAKLLKSQVVNVPNACISAIPGFDSERPTQETTVPNLMLAGDWTQTGCTSTMEGAVRSGNLAAEAVLRYLGRPKKLVAEELPIDWLARRWLGA